MGTITKYQEILKTTNAIALATTVENIPNVRIVNFCRKPETPDILYFASDRSNRKVTEFAQNDNVAFTTIPSGDGICHIRSNKATVKKSTLAIDEMAPLFIAAIPGYGETLEAIGDTLDVFEIHVKEAIVISGFEEPDLIVFG